MEASPLYADLTRRILSSDLSGSSAFSFPSLVQGDTLTIGLRFAQNVGGSPIEVSRNVQSLRAVIGKLDARPERGSFQLTIGPDAASPANTTATLQHNETAKAVQDAINALPDIVAEYGSATVTTHAGSWIVKFGAGTVEVEIAATANDLFPISFCRVRAYANHDAEWLHEVRLIQAPVALTDTSERIVPPPPKITRLQAGGFNGTSAWNEVQKLFVPPQFVGTFQIRRGYAKSTLLSLADGPEETAEAIKALADEDGEFLVTNPTNYAMHIEFKGSMAATEQDLLTVEVYDAPEGDLTFSLPLDSWELATVLRASKDGEVKLPFEISAELADEADADTFRPVKLYRGEVKIKRELGFDEIAVAKHVDWLRGPKRRDYIPFSLSQVITGTQHHSSALGDGVATSFTVEHGLETESLHVTLRENSSNLPALVHGTDYTWTPNDADSLTVTMLTGNPRASGSVACLISSAGPKSAFQDHGHTIPQVYLLRQELDALGSRIEVLEDLIPSGAAEVTNKEQEGVIAEWPLPPIFEVFPSRTAIKGASLATVDLPLSLRPGGLYPAIHDATVENVSSLPSTFPVPSATYKGKVYTNNTGANVLAPGGMGTRSMNVKPGEFVGCDGRAWYRVAKYAPTSQTTFYPTAFERELFMFHVDGEQLRLKKTFKLSFGMELAVLNANTRAQWSVIVQVGTATQETTPATTGANLKDVEWVSTPLLEHRMILTRVPSTHKFGVNIKRALVGVVDTLTAEKVLYGNAKMATPPALPTFAIRALLARFDTEDSEENARGFVAVRGLALSTGGATDSEDGKAVIK
ncbi:hypothetical protein [Verrucomicrobium sp. BvORR106]|uniref:hypothetical protein n=1 Tax=Verrucomicrobium sp. BvORR106 TaxID=1403819 RepID=UPI00056E065F|nr:hypothetical protein [Verrucomicrobium sp. BvORR106]